MLWIHVAANEAPDEDRLLYAQKFFEAGFTFSETVTAAPDEETLVHIIETARESHDVLIVSGGLAPGGASRAAVARALSIPLEDSRQAAAHIESFCYAHGTQNAPDYLCCAQIPDGGFPLLGDGVIPGFACRRDEKVIAVLEDPGDALLISRLKTLLTLKRSLPPPRRRRYGLLARRLQTPKVFRLIAASGCAILMLGAAVAWALDDSAQAAMLPVVPADESSTAAPAEAEQWESLVVDEEAPEPEESDSVPDMPSESASSESASSETASSPSSSESPSSEPASSSEPPSSSEPVPSEESTPASQAPQEEPLPVEENLPVEEELEVLEEPASSQPEENASSKTQTEKSDVSNETLYYTTSGVQRKMNAYELVGRVVQRETSGQFAPEALKAQVVASYTMIKYNNQQGLAPTVLLADNISAAVKKALDAVLGRAVYYQGALANTVYHSTSAGATTSAKSVWGGSLPYLVSVESDWDRDSPYYLYRCSVSEENFAALAKSVYGITPNGDPEDWITVKHDAPGGYVGTVKIGGYPVSQGGSYGRGKTITGRSIREQFLDFSLRSHCFDVDYKNGKFYFTSYGYGHGVGMSQFGAQFMALDGYDYVEILEHYYTGTTIK